MFSFRGIKLAYIILLSATLYGCANHPPERLYANEDHLLGKVMDPDADKWYEIDKSDGWFKAYTDSHAQQDDVSLAEKYLSMGMALSQSLCFKQLDDVQRRQNNHSFSQGEFNLLVILGTGILGVNEASPENLTRLALGAAAVNSTLDLYRNHYLLGPDGDVIVDMVKGGMRTLRQEIENSPSPQTFVQAYGQLEAFSNTCTSTSIRKLVRDAIKSANVVATDTLRNTVNDVHKDNIAEALNRNGLSYEQLAAVYWYALEQPSDKYDDYLTEALEGITLKDIKDAREDIRSAFRSMPKLMATYSSWVRAQKLAVDVALKAEVAKRASLAPPTVMGAQDEKDLTAATIVAPPRAVESGVVFLKVD